MELEEAFHKSFFQQLRVTARNAVHTGNDRDACDDVFMGAESIVDDRRIRKFDCSNPAFYLATIVLRRSIKVLQFLVAKTPSAVWAYPRQQLIAKSCCKLSSRISKSRNSKTTVSLELSRKGSTIGVPGQKLLLRFAPNARSGATAATLCA